ncbi:MAG: ABC transporter permease [Dehalococcoidia bacterium]|uniref:ABC transporter permease n=1 Tax=Candidatus Amarobacter glycogenicus TaxID=3140699 RepID=UPI001D31F167|nr:ABC transporter permease [Dehalococcoidia bacterium]MBK6561137.1 ABC transporter permease [Dehalococcoidia bacterium]MBK7725062.1 ABC transporter permease [Dehalococcoidia bacterium]MBK9343726.1 ABC transporter permease [Dehalococcoidia bacterium]MBK9545397.1 ABC transporter permease [Dehalococcoidia bacterium]
MATETTLQPFDFARDPFATKQRGLWEMAFQRLIRNRLAFVSAIILIFITVLAISAQLVPFIERHDATVQQYSIVNEGPSSEYWLGTDILGRDMWARLLYGTLFSLKIGLGTQLIVLLVGITIGMGAALGGKLSDTILMWFTDLAYAFPDLLAIILLRQVLFGRDWPIIGTGDPQIPGFPSAILGTILAISLVSWVTIARLVRGQMLSIKEQDYVLAARSIGASPWRVVRAHMLPNTLSTVIVSVTFGIPLAIFAEGALGFIGLGVPSPYTSLGALMGDGYAYLFVNNWLVVWPAIMVAILMLCFTFLGDGLRDALDPRTRK